MSNDHIRVFSLNCWGLKYISKNRVDRINAIAEVLSTAPYDIICLQELFVSRDFETIRASVSKHLPFFKLFHGGAVGKGLVIFSRFPIVAATIQAYSLNGSPLDLKGGDWFAGKGAASVLITHPVLGQVQVFNTHFFSEGGDDGPEHNRAHRLVNAWQFAKLAKQSAEIGHHVIATGDFNSIPSTLPMTVVRQHAGLDDAWAWLHPPPAPSQISGGSHVNPVDALSHYGFTYDSPLDSYSQTKNLSTSSTTPQGKRLDYILFRNPARPASALHSSSWAAPLRLVPIEARVVLAELVPGHSFSYSDHFGVAATFKIEGSELKTRLLPDVPADGDVPTVASTDENSPGQPHLGRNATLMMLEALKTRLEHARVHGQWQRRIWLACVGLLVCVVVGPAWSPTGFLTPLFVFLGAVVTWLGTTMFYVGFLYSGWEASGLQNVIEELELYAQSSDL